MDTLDPPIADRLLTMTEAADYCGVTIYSVRRWIAERCFPVVRLNQRVVRIRMSALEAFIKRQTVQAVEL